MLPSSHHHDTPLPAPTEMEEAALAWFARCQRGLSEAQDVEFQNWLTADPRHAALFNELDGTWELLGRVEEAPSLAVASPVHSERPVWFVRLGLPLAAAAVLAIAYFAWWRPAHYSDKATTEVGALRTLPLPDGSLVTLNTNSAVGVAFTPAERRVTLGRGEAHFTVAKNPERPFIVEAGGVLVRAVGTAFKVHLENQAVEVLVTEGRVRVDDAISGKSLLANPPGLSAEALLAAGPPVLASGQKVVVALPAPMVKVESPLVETTATTVSSEEIKRELAWRSRRLDFELAPLSEIVAEFNRYSRHPLIIGDATLAQKRFGGSFKPDDQAGFVRMLQENFGVTVQETETATVLRSGP